MVATQRSSPDPVGESLSRGTVLRYAIGSLGTGGFSTLPGLVLVYYLTDTLGVAALVAGILVTAAKIWDVVIDPVIGVLSDRILQRRGSRRPLMVVGSLVLPVFFVLTFGVPAGASPGTAGLWVLLAFLLSATGFSLFQVPYIALPAEIASSYDQRTRLLTWRVVVLTVAILLFGAGGPALRALGGDDYSGYLLMAVVAAVVIAAGMLLSVPVAPARAAAAARAAHPPTDRTGRTASGAVTAIVAHYRAGISVLRRSQPFRTLLLTYLLQGMATGEMLACANYVATYVLHSEDAVTLLFIALIGPALVCTPLWGVVARRIGKERGFLLASILFGVATLSMLGLAWAPGVWLYLPVAVAGAAYAAMQSLPMAMLPDTISHDAKTNGQGRAGIFGGMWTAGETTGMALGAAVLAVVLAVTGYRQHTGGEAILQSAGSVTGIVVAFSIVPAALVGLSLIPLIRYRLRRGDIDDDHDDAR